MYRKNTASQYIYFVLVKASDGTALTGATVTAYRALDNGSQASATGTTTELANGQYRFNLSQADTNADYGSYLFTAATAVPVEKTVVFTAANPTDSAAFGLSKFGDIETDTQDIQSRLPAALVSGRIDASVGAMAANTLTASALATDAATEISNLTASAVFSYEVQQGEAFGNLVWDIDQGVLAIEADTQDIQARLPTSLVSGRMDSSVGAMAANTITASALAADAAGEVADAVWDEAYSQHTTAGSFGKLMDTLRKANMVVDGVVTSAVSPTTTSFSSTVNYPTGAFKHAVLLWVNGSSIAEQNSPILTYTNTNGVITVEEAFTAAPQVGDEFIIIPTTHVHAVSAIQSGLATSSGVTAAFSEIKGAGWSSSTDTLEEIRDAVDAIDISGGATVNVLPASANAPKRGQGTDIDIYVGETISQAITVYQADGTTPLSLSGKTLTVVVDKFDGSDVVTVPNSSISVSGASTNIATFNWPSGATSSVGQRWWSLRDASAPKTVYAFGQLNVLQTALAD